MDKEKDIAQFALDYALRKGCQQAKVLLSMGQENELEVRDGKVDGLHHSNGCDLTLSLFVDGSYSNISTNRLDRDELMSFIDNGIVSTRFLAPDPFRVLPDKNLYYRGEMNDFGLYDVDFDKASVDDKVGVAMRVFNEIVDDRVISASVSIGDDEDFTYLIDSNGFEGEMRQSDFSLASEVSVSGLGDERPEGFNVVSSPLWNNLEKVGVAKEACARAVSKLGAAKIASGKYSVVIDRRASSKLLSPIISAMTGSALHQRSSFLLDKKGTKIASDKLTVVDDPLQSGKYGAKLFDVDGVALKRLPLIENGVLTNYYISQYMGKKMNVEATTGSLGILDFAQGDLDTPALVRAMNDGVLITGFNGGNCNGTTGDFSYGIEGFLVKDGIIVKPVNEMLMTGNMIDLWSNLQDLSNDPLPYSVCNIPSLFFDDVTLN